MSWLCSSSCLVSYGMPASRRDCMLCEEERAKRIIAETDLAKLQRTYVALLSELESCRRQSHAGFAGDDNDKQGKGKELKTSIESARYLSIVVEWILGDIEIDKRKKVLARLEQLELNLPRQSSKFNDPRNRDVVTMQTPVRSGLDLLKRLETPISQSLHRSNENPGKPPRPEDDKSRTALASFSSSELRNELGWRRSQLQGAGLAAPLSQPVSPAGKWTWTTAQSNSVPNSTRPLQNLRSESPKPSGMRRSLSEDGGRFGALPVLQTSQHRVETPSTPDRRRSPPHHRGPSPPYASPKPERSVERDRVPPIKQVQSPVRSRLRQIRGRIIGRYGSWDGAFTELVKNRGGGARGLPVSTLHTAVRSLFPDNEAGGRQGRSPPRDATHQAESMVWTAIGAAQDPLHPGYVSREGWRRVEEEILLRISEDTPHHHGRAAVNRGIEKVCVAVLSLLTDANPEHGLNNEALELYRRDRVTFADRARQVTQDLMTNPVRLSTYLSDSHAGTVTGLVLIACASSVAAGSDPSRHTASHFSSVVLLLVIIIALLVKGYFS
ncbi:hypothetical protein FOL47_010656 [Perkinsus chesapeaki]|uniref:Uncharacterized protein n=1 Tax=Perkinsus chesapeaki TaxID=330153 RepID=A0A7J6L351_PERCH|nr:hypothetical protein FOL47_010656 [Perkinsus chesapeaki]